MANSPNLSFSWVSVDSEVALSSPTNLTRPDFFIHGDQTFDLYTFNEFLELYTIAHGNNYVGLTVVSSLSLYILGKLPDGNLASITEYLHISVAND